MPHIDFIRDCPDAAGKRVGVSVPSTCIFFRCVGVQEGSRVVSDKRYEELKRPKTATRSSLPLHSRSRA